MAVDADDDVCERVWLGDGMDRQMVFGIGCGWSWMRFVGDW